MSEESLDRVLGQISALHLVLAAVIRALPTAGAARAGAELLLAHKDTQNRDSEDGTPPATAATRDEIVDAYQGLLRAMMPG